MKRSSPVGMDRRKWIQGIAVAGAAGAMPAAEKNTASPRSSHPVVETSSGRIRGCTSRGVWVFRGLPYGAPTEGPNRFMPPRKPQPWAGVRSCLTYGRVCPTGVALVEDGGNRTQGDEDNFLLYRTGPGQAGEDCLRLNVFTPGGSGGKRPVMVYMHGGGFSGGSGNGLLSYDGENLARHHDVVVVTHNHRLNVFGYLNLAGLGGERYAASANVGMLDNVAVLEWVRDNISNFGGDPNNVLIYGQSGGGGKVSMLMAMPAAKGLFHRAAVQSGATLRAGMPERTTQLAAAVLAELRISPSQIEKIHAVPTLALMTAQAAAVRKMSGPGRRGDWGPTMDGSIIPSHPFDPTAPALSANVPLLIGTCLNEFVNGVDNPEVDTLTEGELNERVSKEYGAQARDIVAAYRREYPRETPFGLWAAISAAPRARQNAITQAERKAAQNAAPVYHYLYAWRTPMLDNRPGTFHSSEIAFVFDNADLCPRYSGGGPEGRALSSRMGEAWAAFARTGKPGHRALPEWPAYTAATRATMVFDNQCRIKNDPEGEGLRLMKKA